jgi:hypothetical protein
MVPKAKPSTIDDDEEMERKSKQNVSAKAIK